MTHESELIASARLTELDHGRYKISQVVVVPELQGKGHGKAILNYAVGIAKKAGTKSIELNAQVKAKEQYCKLGFRELGEVRIVKLTGVPHITMLLEC